MDVVEPQPAALGLAHVDAHAAPLGGDQRERLVEVRAAAADERAEHVAGQALAVHGHQHGLVAGDVAAQQGDVLAAVDDVLPAEALERPGPRRQLGARGQGEQTLVREAVRNELADRHARQVVRAREVRQLGRAREVALVLAHHGAQHARRGAAGHARQVDGRLAEAGALEHPRRARAQRKDRAWPHEVACRARRVGQRADRPRAVVRRHAGASEVDRHGERNRLPGRRALDHERDPERIEALGRQRDADQPRGVREEEHDRVRHHRVGRHHELAEPAGALGVHDHHGAPGGDRRQRRSDAGGPAVGLRRALAHARRL